MRIFILTFLLVLAVHSSKGQSIFDTLTNQEKIEGISLFWKEASYNFVFFDKTTLNWDSAYYAYLPKVLNTKNVYEYYETLSEFASLLKDGHTSIMRTDYFYKSLGAVPIMLKTIDNRSFVSRIDERLIREVPLGTEVLAINNMPVKIFLSKGNSLSGFKDTKLTFTFRQKNNITFSKMITRVAGKDQVKYLPDFTWTPILSRQIDQDVFYVKMDSFDDSTLVTAFESVLPQIQKSKFLIFDVRENGGGNGDYAKRIAEHLVDKNYIVGSAWKARINNSAKKAWGSLILFGDSGTETISDRDYYLNNEWEVHEGDTSYISETVEKIKIPIVILIGPNTFSAAEDFLIFLDGSKNIKTVGQLTAGSSGQPVFVSLPKGITGRICAKRDTYPDGREFINIGIKPDFVVGENLDDFNKGIDTALQFAIHYLKTYHR